jgi:hypothetical protein
LGEKHLLSLIWDKTEGAPDGFGERSSMDEGEFLMEMERIKEDINDFPRPYSPCEYFHGREKLFREDQFKKIVEFFREHQQKRFER